MILFVHFAIAILMAIILGISMAIICLLPLHTSENKRFFFKKENKKIDKK